MATLRLYPTSILMADLQTRQHAVKYYHLKTYYRYCYILFATYQVKIHEIDKYTLEQLQSSLSSAKFDRVASSVIFPPNYVSLRVTRTLFRGRFWHAMGCGLRAGLGFVTIFGYCSFFCVHRTLATVI